MANADSVSALVIRPANLLNDLKSFGFFFENMAVKDLSIYAESFGGEVKHYRDSNGLEVDAILKLNNGEYNPKAQKFTKTDLAKYINASEMRPYDVSWGAEVNMTRFQINMEKEWDKSNLKYNEKFYKELIAKAILYKEIERIISNEEWYQNNKGYRAQLVPYTFSKFVYEITKLGLCINYKKIWEQQSCLIEYKTDLAKIAKLVYDVLNDTNRQILNIGEYAKREICWNKLNENDYSLSSETKSQLISKDDAEVEARTFRNEQRLTNEIVSEVAIFKLGVNYWKKVQEVGRQLNELSEYECRLCDIAIKYILQQYKMLTKKQAKDIWLLKLKMEKYIGE